MSENRIRILVAKPGLDGHDRGAKTVVHALREAGFEVIYGGLHQTVEQIVKAAVEEDVDVIGLSVLSGAHLPVTEKLMAELRKADATDKKVVVGGVIPDEDVPKLLKTGVAAVFPTGSRYDEIVAFMKGVADAGK